MSGKKVWKSVNKSRLRELISWFWLNYEPKCWICKEKMSEFDIKRNKWTRHHIDEVHENNVRGNVVLVHRSCHRKYHQNPH